MKKYKINEIIYTIQGESNYAGYPCTIVRFSGCNLRCIYCDTKYAFDEGKYWRSDEIIKEIKKIGCELIEFTGGEPLLQPDIGYLIDLLINENYKILIETNGSQDISLYNRNAVFIIDVKCPGSGEEQSFLKKNLEYIQNKDNLKFVMAELNDYNWAKDFIEKNDLIGYPNLIFSPVWEKVDFEELALLMLKDNLNHVRLQVQLHKIIWGPDRKGV